MDIPLLISYFNCNNCQIFLVFASYSLRVISQKVGNGFQQLIIFVEQRNVLQNFSKVLE
jgi:hypothetical protein